MCKYFRKESFFEEKNEGVNAFSFSPNMRCPTFRHSDTPLPTLMLFVKRLLMLLVSLLMLGAVPQAVAAGFAWELVSRDGKDYVPVDNVRAFYGFTAPERSESGWRVVENKKTQIKLRARSQEILMNNLKFVLSHPVSEDPNGRLYISRIDVVKILDPILRPSYIKSAGSFKTVILDPGHGGHDAGATNHFARESDLNLRLAKKLKASLQKKGFNVVMTRDTDTFLTLQQRVDIANKHSNAIFISLHFNSARRDACGMETFTLTPKGTSSSFQGKKSSDANALRGNAQDSANIALATAVQGTLQRRMATVDRGIKRARFSVLCGVLHPAILFEGGFMTNQRESVYINNETYLGKMADHLADAVSKYRKAVTR